MLLGDIATLQQDRHRAAHIAANHNWLIFDADLIDLIFGVPTQELQPSLAHLQDHSLVLRCAGPKRIIGKYLGVVDHGARDARARHAGAAQASRVIDRADNLGLGLSVQPKAIGAVAIAARGDQNHHHQHDQRQQAHPDHQQQQRIAAHPFDNTLDGRDRRRGRLGRGRNRHWRQRRHGQIEAFLIDRFRTRDVAEHPHDQLMRVAWPQVLGVKYKFKRRLLQHRNLAIQFIFDLGDFVVANLNRRHDFDLTRRQTARLNRLASLGEAGLNLRLDRKTGAKGCVRGQLAPQPIQGQRQRMLIAVRHRQRFKRDLILGLEPILNHSKIFSRLIWRCGWIEILPTGFNRNFAQIIFVKITPKAHRKHWDGLGLGPIDHIVHRKGFALGVLPIAHHHHRPRPGLFARHQQCFVNRLGQWRGPPSWQILKSINNGVFVDRKVGLFLGVNRWVVGRVADIDWPGHGNQCHRVVQWHAGQAFHRRIF